MSSNLFHLLKTRYIQLGGLRLVREYARMGLLWPAAKTVLRHPFSKQTYKQVYPGYGEAGGAVAEGV